MHLWSINLQQRRQEYSIQWRKESLSSKRCWENWTAACKRMKLEYRLNTICKNKLKMDSRPMCKIKYVKLLDENMGRKHIDINHNSIVFGSISYSNGNKSKNEQKGFPGGTTDKELACQGKRWRFNPWVWETSGLEYGNPLQYSCLENSMDRGAWWATVHRVAKGQTRLKLLSIAQGPNLT